jgi:hypothetical protein
MAKDKGKLVLRLTGWCRKFVIIVKAGSAGAQGRLM